MVRRGVVGLLFIVLFFVLFSARSFKSAGTVNVAIAGDPVIIASWQKEGNLVLVTIPATFAIDAVGGMGKYPIRSLWQLGEIEGVSGDTLAGSLEELSGVPIPFYIGGAQTQGDTLARIKRVFSPAVLTNFFTHRFKTNISQFTLLSLVWKTNVNPDKTKIIAIDSGQVEIETEADGSTLAVINQHAVDNKLGDTFENRELREEKLTIRVDNATQWPGLAQSVARKINRVGGNVVGIGNREKSIDTCQIEGTDESLKTKTAVYIASLFSCKNIEVKEQNYTDLTVVIGRAYESRFRPRESLPPQ